MVKPVSEVNATVERNDLPPNSEFEERSHTDVTKPTEYLNGDPTITTEYLNESSGGHLDVYQNPFEGLGTEVNAMATNVTQSGGALTTNADSFDDGRGNFSEVNQTYVNGKSPTPTPSPQPSLSSSAEHFEGLSTANMKGSDVAKENSPEVYRNSEANSYSEVSSVPISTAQFAPSPNANTREDDVNEEDSWKPGIHSTAKSSADAIYTNETEVLPQVPEPPPIGSTVPASTENYQLTTSIKSTEPESKSTPKSDSGDSTNELLSFKDRISIFENKSNAIYPQSTNRAVKIPSNGSAKSSHQPSVVKQSVDEKPKNVSKSASSSATAAPSSSSKRSSSDFKSVNKKDDSDSDSDDSDDYSSSDSDSTTSSDDAKEEHDCGRTLAF